MVCTDRDDEIEDPPYQGTKSKIPALQAITSLLHAGGKIDATNSAYKTSRGCFGDTKVRLAGRGSVTLDHLYKHWCAKTLSSYDIIITDRSTGELVSSRVVVLILSKHA